MYITYRTSSSDNSVWCWTTGTSGVELFWVRVEPVTTWPATAPAPIPAPVVVPVGCAVELEWCAITTVAADGVTMPSREEWEDALEPSVIGRVAGGSFSAAMDISNWSIRLYIQTYTCTYTVYTCTCTHIVQYIYMYTYTYMYIVYAYTCTSPCVMTWCLCVHVHVRVYIHTVNSDTQFKMATSLTAEAVSEDLWCCLSFSSGWLWSPLARLPRPLTAAPLYTAIVTYN